MTTEEAVELVSRVRHAFPFPKWGKPRFAIYVEHLVDLPYPAVRAAVDELIRTKRETFAPAVGEIRARAEGRILRGRTLAQAMADRKLLAAPKDPAIGRLLRETVKRLEARAQAAAAKES